MDPKLIADLLVLQSVAEAGSFTRAAARMGRAQSGLSQAVRTLEERLGVPLLARTTRNVRLTEAGHNLLAEVEPALRQIENGLRTAAATSREPTGLIRITASDFPAQEILLPAVAELTATYPKIEVDIQVADQFVDIVKSGFDAGIRFGSHLEKDMVALPVGPDMKAAVVGSPDYFQRGGRPYRIDDLDIHDCINYRLASHGALYRWLFQDEGRAIEYRSQGRITLNDGRLLMEAAAMGLGLAYVFEAHAKRHLASGSLETCLEAFCPTWPGYHLYYPGRNQKAPALSALIKILRKKRI
ncbi:transcriptional regulator [Rhizobium leguminosarum bv. trifolii WSM597]|uniref:HTH-type transcriptional regulator TtuA n=1 Tax=Rhizobium leguminosarum bv. trifolii WSM597 TaxID=754764 RepID=J0H9H9_RHILT|nr:LysR family transcriptional regulator [Rhizobium leguminosarum]EJB07008.1 transcriptional regulator [Rhizobium leguminosarum bv. trifolii WSM597]